jgi:hypothetical protein
VTDAEGRRTNGTARCVWTLASALHIRTAMPSRANQAKENKMAKKSKKPLKKAKKLEATKPLLRPDFVPITHNRP